MKKLLTASLLSLLCALSLCAQKKPSYDAHNAVRFGFITPLAGHIDMTYEHALNPHVSLDFTAGYIGVNSDIRYTPNKEKCKGFLVRFGPKFRLSPMRKDAPSLHKFYLQPELSFSSYKMLGWEQHYSQMANGTNLISWETYETGSNSAGLLLFLGNTWSIGHFTIDTRAGIGYATSEVWRNPEDSNGGYYFNWDEFEDMGKKYTFFYFGDSFPLAVNAGFSLGYAW